MGHIAFGAPSIASYHLHERLHRALQQRGHRVDVLATDAAHATFYLHQELPVVALGAKGIAHRTAWQQRIADAAQQWFAATRPQLLLLHQRRGMAQQVLQQIATQNGCRVLWTGAGLLPHTLQVDELGIDGDAGVCRRAAHEFRAVTRDEPLLAACLAHAVADARPIALPRREPTAPDLRQRIRDLLPMARDLGMRAAFRSLTAWNDAMATPAPTETLPPDLPTEPFVAVLLQAPDDPRIRLDAEHAPSCRELIETTCRAVATVAPQLEVVAVADDRTRSSRTRRSGVRCLPATAAAVTAAIATATVTINHPAAAVALLAGSPVLHLGAALYGLRGVTHRTTQDALAADLGDALRRDHPALRGRFLSWMFRHGHVWCSATDPDHNGMLGLVQAIEARLPTTRRGNQVYRAGPAWPLSRGTRP